MEMTFLEYGIELWNPKKAFIMLMEIPKEGENPCEQFYLVGGRDSENVPDFNGFLVNTLNFRSVKNKMISLLQLEQLQLLDRLTCEGMFLLVVVHWKAPDEALVNSTSVVSVQTHVITVMIG